MNRRRAQQTSFPEMCREAMGDYGDCCANQANADPARCADGYYPSHQPQSYDGCEDGGNFECFSYTPAVSEGGSGEQDHGSGMADGSESETLHPSET